MSRVFWPSRIVEKWDVPHVTKEFLSRTGLPLGISDMWIEFGVFESEESYVIGLNNEDPVILEKESGKVLIEEGGSSPLYLNKSVIILSEFVEKFEAFKELDFELDSLRIELGQLVSVLRQIDEDAVEDPNTSFWAQVFEDMSAFL